MVKRIVIDDPPGSGKTTLISGRGHEDPPCIEFDCLKRRGLNSYGESRSKIAGDMIREGKSPLAGDLSEFISRLLGMERRRYYEAADFHADLCFFEIGLPAYEILGRMRGIDPTPEFQYLCQELRYDDPIIVLQPIMDFDISTSRPSHGNRVFTIEQRMQIKAGIIDCYRKREYNVVEIPYIAGQGTTPRIEMILAAVNGTSAKI